MARQQLARAELLESRRAPTPIPVAKRPLGPARAADRGVMKDALPSSTVDTLARFASAHAVAPATVLRAIWAVLLGRYSLEEEVVFGVARSRAEEARPL